MILHSSIILSIRIRSGLLASIVLSVCTLKSHNSLTCSFSVTGSTLWSYHFSVSGRPYFLHRAQCIVVATLSCHFLHFVWAICEHSLTIWLTVSSFSLHNLHIDTLVLFSIFAFLWFVLKAWTWDVMIRLSVSLFKLPLFIHCQVYFAEFSSVCLRCWPFIALDFQFSVWFPSVHFYTPWLHCTLSTFITKPAFLMISVSLPLVYCFRLWLSYWTTSSTLIRPLPPLFLLRVHLSTSRNSAFVHSSIPAPYLNSDTAHVLMVLNRFPEFSPDFNSFVSLLRYSYTIALIFTCLKSSASKILGVGDITG